MPDEVNALLLRLKNGDRPALRDLYECLNRPVYFLALSILKNKTDAEDVLQDTFIALCTHIGKYKPGSGRSWVMTIARNKAINLVRKSRAHPTCGLDALIDFADPAAAAYSDVVACALELLNVKRRQIVLLHLTLDLPHREIAKIINMPEGSVRRNYAAAIQQIREQWKEHELC